MLEKAAERTVRAAAWARAASATDNEDRVFCLLTLTAAGEQNLGSAVHELRENQQEEGGW